MSPPQQPILLATRGSPLALAQTHAVLRLCEQALPDWRFEIRRIKTTGDKLQTASMAQPAQGLPKGLFTKELELALLAHEADLAVHSLKDLPTDLPEGLTLGAILARADARDALIYRGPHPGRATETTYPPALRLQDLRPGATVATSSTRRREQLLALRKDLRVVEIRGNVGTRLRKVADLAELDATLLAAAGLFRLGFRVGPGGQLIAPPQADGTAARLQAPPGLLATLLDPSVMLPAVGQAAVGLEIRRGDPVAEHICLHLDHVETRQCVTAERAFLHAMGGGCQAPIAAYAEVRGDGLRLQVISFRDGPPRQADVSGPVAQALELGRQLAAKFLAGGTPGRPAGT